jgi:hypothetical protein
MVESRTGDCLVFIPGTGDQQQLTKSRPSKRNSDYFHVTNKGLEGYVTCFGHTEQHLNPEPTHLNTM